MLKPIRIAASLAVAALALAACSPSGITAAAAGSSSTAAPAVQAGGSASATPAMAHDGMAGHSADCDAHEGDASRKPEHCAAMALTDQGQAFSLLTGDLDAGTIISVADELAGVKTIEAFLDGYRARLQEARLSEIN